MKKVASLFAIFFVMIVLIVATTMPVLFTAQQGLSNENFLPGSKLPKKCLDYKATIEEHVTNERILNIQEHTFILLAIMAQESGCDAKKTSDLFQASESLGLPRNTLGTTASIEQGVKYFGQGYQKAQEFELRDIRFVIQGYNFGYGFLEYVNNSGRKSGFNKEIAYAFAEEKGGGYGDRDYVEHVLQYLEVQSPIMTGGVFSTAPLVGNQIVMTQPYGSYTDGTGNHWGIDISVGFGAIVVAADAGEVIEIHRGHCPDFQGLGSICGGGYGNGVTIRHVNGLYTRYGHLQSGSLIVFKGQQVQAGQKIGLQGSSGKSSGTHLHFEVRVSPGYEHADNRQPLDYIKIPGINNDDD